MKSDSYNYSNSIFAGLLSSSCCLIQLIFNLLGSLNILVDPGCIGFNKVLGPPVRLYLRAMTWMWILYGWVSMLTNKSDEENCCDGDVVESSPFLMRKRRQRRSSLVRSTILTLCLMYLPEMLRFYGDYSSTHKGKISQVIPFSKEQDVAQKSVQQQDTKLMDIVVDGMDCEHCVAAVRTILEGTEGVLSVGTIDLATGHAQLTVLKSDALYESDAGEENNDGSSNITSLLDERLRDGGYDLVPFNNKQELEYANNMFEKTTTSKGSSVEL